MENIANPKEKKILSDNVKDLMGGFSQDRIKKAKLKSGVSEGTIANMVSLNKGNPTLSNIAAFASAYKVSIADLLTENLGRNRAQEGTAASPATQASPKNLSRTGRMLLERLEKIESAGHTPSALYALIENALDLVQPIAGGNDYAGLDDL